MDNSVIFNSPGVPSKIGAYLKLHLKINNISPKELAKATGLTEKEIEGVIDGTADFKFYKIIVRYLNMDTDLFFAAFDPADEDDDD